MSRPAYLDVVRTVGIGGDPYLTVSPYPDDPSQVSLSAVGLDAKKWFGAVEIPMETQFARQLGKALINCADELDALEKENS